MKQKVRPSQHVVPCWECSRRRLVCDLGTPKCRKCRVRGVDCPGYQHKPLQWMRPGQTRSKGAQSAKTLGISGPPAPSDEVIANCTLLGQETPTRVQKRKASEDSKVDDASSAPVFEIQPVTRGDNINIAPDLSGKCLEGTASPFIIPPSYTLICSALGHRILQTAEGFQRERNAMALNLQQRRGEALRLVRRELTGGRDSIMPILCLLLSEVYRLAIRGSHHLYSDSILTCIPCAPGLLAEVIRINNYRFLKDSAAALLAGGSYGETGQGFMVRRIGWERIGRIYQAAVVLYCLASQPQGSNHVRKSSQWTTLRAALLQDLRDSSLDAYLHHRKLVLWPLTILGLVLDYDDGGTQQFVLKELKWASATLGTATPLVAMQLLERTWRSRQRHNGWDELFDRPYIFAL
ncbi:hypothetical protein IWW34DRAFT_810955 [Fusarium oxysporum f. sp. albedinis]|nr:hypothetical protein IWW34DRAFT_810955 [Fusarium oxysporum f. sp. albedinis]